MTALRFWALMLLLAAVIGGLLNLILRDAEVAAGVLCATLMAIATLVLAPLLERYER